MKARDRVIIVLNDTYEHMCGEVVATATSPVGMLVSVRLDDMVDCIWFPSCEVLKLTSSK